MLPHGPRPTTIAARQQRERRARATPATVSPIAARDSGRRRGGGRRAAGGRRGSGSVTNEPVDDARRRPAAGAWPATGSVRRPLASITAWPTCAANPSATRITPTEKSVEDEDFEASSGVGRGLGQAAAAPPGSRAGRCGPATARRLDLEDEAAVGAGVDRPRAAEAAHRAGHRERSSVHCSQRIVPGRVDRARRAGSRAGRAGRSARRPAPISATRGPSSNVDLHARLADLVDERCRAS